MFTCLSRIEKSLKEQGFSVKRADREDLKRILAVYYGQNVTTERFEDNVPPGFSALPFMLNPIFISPFTHPI